MSGKGPTVVQAFLIMSCGVALAFFGCMGMLSPMSGGSGGSAGVSDLGLVAFIVGLAGFAAGGLLMVVRFFRMLFGGTRSDEPIEKPLPPYPPEGE